jgi:hypothetical protein
MDPETAHRFDSLERAMARLASAQEATSVQVRELAHGLTQTNAAVRELAQAQARTDDRLATLTERVDRLAQLMIRGHTEAAERHATMIERLDKLEER